MVIGDNGNFHVDIKETIEILIDRIDFCRNIEKCLLVDEGGGDQFEKKKCNITVVNVNHDQSIRKTIDSYAYPADQNTIGVKHEQQHRRDSIDSTDRFEKNASKRSWIAKVKHFLSHCLHHYHVMPPDYRPPPRTTTKKKSKVQIVKNDKKLNENNFLKTYFGKMLAKPKSRVKIKGADAFASFITSLLGMMALTSLDYYFLTTNTRTTVVIGSFAATAVLTFAAIDSPLAQPKNVFFGHIISALVGVSMQILLGNKHQWLAAALAVSVAILLMCLTDTVHPPGGATALIAVYSDQKIRDLKFFYVLIPVASGALILFLVALLANNCFPWRKYPKYWN